EMAACPATAAAEIRAFIAKGLKSESATVRAGVVYLLPGKETGAAESMPLAALAWKVSLCSVRGAALVWLFDNAPFKPDAAMPLLTAAMKDPYVTNRTTATN